MLFDLIWSVFRVTGVFLGQGRSCFRTFCHLRLPITFERPTWIFFLYIVILRIFFRKVYGYVDLVMANRVYLGMFWHLATKMRLKNVKKAEILYFSLC